MLFDDCFDYCWLVDIGDYENVADALPPGIEVKGLLLTHTHFDHSYGINALPFLSDSNIYVERFNV